MAAQETGSASAATGKCHEIGRKNVIVCEKEVVFQRPPSGRHTSSTTPVNKTPALKTTHLLFEPAPPSHQQIRKFPSSHSSHYYRRIQSAHGRIGSSPSPENHRTHTIVKNRGVPNKTRPKSATVLGEVTCGTRSDRAYPGKTAITPVPKQFLTLDITDPDAKSKTSPNGYIARHSERTSKAGDGRKKIKSSRSIPKGIVQLTPWLTEEAPLQLCGVDAKTCLIFLPCLSDMEELPPELPPVQHYDECVIPYTVLPPQPKPFDPKKLFHYDVERHIQEAEAFYDRRNIYSVDGRLLHEEQRYSRHRTADIIKQEIEDLERLLAGIGRADGNSIVVQYQEEINRLKRSVMETLAQCPKYEEEPVEEPPDLTGLRSFIREREEVIAKIKARRAACIAELDSLALEADVGMTMQKEVLDALRNL